MSRDDAGATAGPARDAPDPPVGDLPPAVRAIVLSYAARALAGLPSEDVPPALAALARFAPGRRARLGASALAAAVQGDPAFRAQVARQAAEPESTNGDDVSVAAARAFLLRLPGRAELIAEAANAADAAALRTQVTDLTRVVEQVTGRAVRLATELDKALAAQHESTELNRYRARLREKGVQVKDAERAAAAATAAAATAASAAAAELDGALAAATAWQRKAEQAATRADELSQALARQHRAASAERSATDRRIGLLLDTVERSAAGLRRELELAAGGDRPADVVAAALGSAVAAPPRSADPGLLAAWLTLPAAHLIVDGYNVTKTGYPDLPLAEQRDRLVRSLSALASRTSAEVSVVFDGAAVTVPLPPGRGVRVLFSPPGVIADVVIRDLVAAEPAGRVVVVVTSDREIVSRVRRDGARTAPSAVLLAALAG